MRTLYVIWFLIVLCVNSTLAQDWQCPINADRTTAWRGVDSLALLRYPNGTYLYALGESFKGLPEAQNAAKAELVKNISGRITFMLKKVQKGELAHEASELSQTAHFDQMPLLHSDHDLVCKGGSGWIAESHIRLQDYSDILKRAYQDSAELFRVNAEQALIAKDAKSFASSWTRAKRLHPTLVSRGLFLVAILADASRGQSVDIAAVLDKTSYPPFFKDAELWQKVMAERESRLRDASVTLAPESSARPFSAPVANMLSAKGVLLKDVGKGATYTLALKGQELAHESAYGSVWTCTVQGSAELTDPKGTVLGKAKLRDESWKDFASGDSTEACNKAWTKMGNSDELAQILMPLFGSFVPVD
jgi:hypothetical protein